MLTPRPPDQVHAIHAGMIANPGALGAHAGWKVGTTNPTAWSGFGLVEPMRAPLFANSIVKAPATYSRKDDNLTMLEAEFAFTLKSELSASWDSPITADDAWAAVDEVFLAIEVCGSRFLPEAFAEASPYQKIADAGMNVALLLGPSFSAEEMRSKDLAGCKAQLIANGEVGGEGTGADVLGRAPPLSSRPPLPHPPGRPPSPTRPVRCADPINSICYLVNALARTGGSLPAGAIVTTGAAAVMQPTGYKAGDTVVAKFEGIGELTLNIAADSKL